MLTMSLAHYQRFDAMRFSNGTAIFDHKVGVG